MLHATCRALRGSGIEVVAMHVHHGLVDAADGWVRHARRLCARWRRAGCALRLRVARLESAPGPGESVEAWARRERYAALARLAREEGIGLVLLAHHRRDQAETVLLQALRGAGPAGLAAMPLVAARDGITWARPWLDAPRQAIEAYLHRHRLHTIDDPSNTDTRFARNRLRHDVWAVLEAAFPHAEAALASLARRAAGAAAALAELAADDLAMCADSTGLHVQTWQRLSPARRDNALRHWCRQTLGAAVPETLIARLGAELPGRNVGTWPAPGAVLELYRGRLRPQARQRSKSPAPPSIDLDLSRPGRHRVAAWSGCWHVEAARDGGLPIDDLRRAQLRPRAGGEQFARVGGGVARALKKQFQAAGIAAAERDAPLVWVADRLLFVPGLGVDARAIAAEGAPQRRLLWLPDPIDQPKDRLLQRNR